MWIIWVIYGFIYGLYGLYGLYMGYIYIDCMDYMGYICDIYIWIIWVIYGFIYGIVWTIWVIYGFIWVLWLLTRNDNSNDQWHHPILSIPVSLSPETVGRSKKRPTVAGGHPLMWLRCNIVC